MTDPKNTNQPQPQEQGAELNSQGQEAESAPQPQDGRAKLSMGVKKCERCDENLALAKRARADYENLKKETEKWKTEFVHFAHEGILLELLPILDNFHEAMAHIKEDQKREDWVIGITYIKKQLEDLLHNRGIIIYGKPGESFDAHFHEAVEEVEGKTDESGKIIKVVRRGYKLGERVIRAAQVVVGK